MENVGEQLIARRFPDLGKQPMGCTCQPPSVLADRKHLSSSLAVPSRIAFFSFHHAYTSIIQVHMTPLFPVSHHLVLYTT